MNNRSEKQESWLDWLKSTRKELDNVTWPSRADVANLTAVVFVLTVLVSLYLGVIDFLLSKGIAFILSING